MELITAYTAVVASPRKKLAIATSIKQNDITKVTIGSNISHHHHLSSLDGALGEPAFVIAGVDHTTITPTIPASFSAQRENPTPRNAIATQSARSFQLSEDVQNKHAM
jgi:hypothetical protein